MSICNFQVFEKIYANTWKCTVTRHIGSVPEEVECSAHFYSDLEQAAHCITNLFNLESTHFAKPLDAIKADRGAWAVVEPLISWQTWIKKFKFVGFYDLDGNVIGFSEELREKFRQIAYALKELHESLVHGNVKYGIFLRKNGTIVLSNFQMSSMENENYVNDYLEFKSIISDSLKCHEPLSRLHDLYGFEQLFYNWDVSNWREHAKWVQHSPLFWGPLSEKSFYNWLHFQLFDNPDLDNLEFCPNIEVNWEMKMTDEKPFYYIYNSRKKAYSTAQGIVKFVRHCFEHKIDMSDYEVSCVIRMLFPGLLGTIYAELANGAFKKAICADSQSVEELFWKHHSSLFLVEVVSTSRRPSARTSFEEAKQQTMEKFERLWKMAVIEDEAAPTVSSNKVKKIIEVPEARARILFADQRQTKKYYQKYSGADIFIPESDRNSPVRKVQVVGTSDQIAEVENCIAKSLSEMDSMGCPQVCLLTFPGSMGNHFTGENGLNTKDFAKTSGAEIKVFTPSGGDITITIAGSSKAIEHAKQLLSTAVNEITAMDQGTGGYSQQGSPSTGGSAHPGAQQSGHGYVHRRAYPGSSSVGYARNQQSQAGGPAYNSAYDSNQQSTSGYSQRQAYSPYGYGGYAPQSSYHEQQQSYGSTVGYGNASYPTADNIAYDYNQQSASGYSQGQAHSPYGYVGYAPQSSYYEQQQSYRGYGNVSYPTADNIAYDYYQQSASRYSQGQDYSQQGYGGYDPNSGYDGQ